MTMTTASPRARHNGRVDESDPAARPRRRSFTAEYKAAIVDEYDQFPVGAPERGALLRREGLYTSHIAEWRKQRDAAALEGLSPKGRAKRSREQVELERLRRRNAHLERELQKTKLALGITGKAHALSESSSKSACAFPVIPSASLVFCNSRSRWALRRRSRSSSTCSRLRLARPLGDRPSNAAASRCLRHSAICEVYRPSRRSSAPRSGAPTGNWSYSSTMAALYSAVNDRRRGRAAGSDSSTRPL